MSGPATEAAGHVVTPGVIPAMRQAARQRLARAQYAQAETIPRTMLALHFEPTEETWRKSSTGKPQWSEHPDVSLAHDLSA